jgi:hypothetical protein
MVRRSRLSGGTVGTVLCLVLAYIVFYPEANIFYKSVNDVSPNDGGPGNYARVSGRLRFAILKPPEFVLQNGVIHLPVRKRKAWPVFLAVGSAKEETWSVERLRNFYTNHPEIKNLWPEPNAPNLGVKWISEDP